MIPWHTGTNGCTPRPAPRRVIGKSLQQQYQRHLVGRQLVIATQTLAELHYGAEVAGWGSQRRDRLKRLVDSALLVPPDEKMCRDFGKLRARLRRIGHPLHQDDHIGDLWIATTASHLGLPLVAHDRIFVDCPGSTYAPSCSSPRSHAVGGQPVLRC